MLPVEIEAEALHRAPSWVQLGRGRPILCLHGGPGADHRYLLESVRVLAERFSVVLVDQARGPQCRDAATLAELLDEIDRVRDEVGAKELGIFGHSWGAALALAYASSRCAGVKAALLVNVVSPSNWAESMADYVMRRLQSPAVVSFLDELERTCAGASLRERSALLDRATRFVPLLHDANRWRDMDYAVVEPRWQEQLWRSVAELLSRAPRPDMPVLVVQGADDVITAADVIDQLGSSSWSARVLPDCGHLAPVDCPDQLGRIASEFFDSVMPEAAECRRR